MDKKEDLNFLKPNTQGKILGEEKEVHNIFNGANEDEHTKRSRRAIRSSLINTGTEDPEELDEKPNSDEEENEM